MPTIVPGRTQKRFRPRPLLRTPLAYAVAVLLFGALGAPCGPKPRFDNLNYVPDVPDPSYPDDDGPIVYFDEAHANHQGSTHGLVALATLAAADGFEVLDLYDPWDQADLTGASIVIQALPATTTSPFESFWIRQFVAQGGGFLGITDHPDHPLSMAALAAGFGVSFVNTLVLYNSSVWYSFGPSLLAIHPITDGVGYVQSYNGSAIAQWPSNATSILTFGEGAIDDATGAPLEGASRLVCGRYGGGRFCFASELQMLTSKCQTTCGNLITGFDGHQQGIPNAEYNEVFALQLLRWLNGWDDPAECGDGLDNDGDGFTDFPADPGCAGSSDATETELSLPCDNDIDEDGDGRVDFDPVTKADPAFQAGTGDPGCVSPTFLSETPECQDGINNDVDQDPNPGRIDFDGGQSIHGACSGGVCPPGVSDPDVDGVADPDPQCVGQPWTREKVKLKKRCGLGFELVFLLPPLMWLHRRRRRVNA